ncbi:MAG TPA: hypothetical protein ENG95_04765 [Nitrospirae bacterium]|nr:hypothetical protein BMS3Abin10_00156 [bacterium BMS3Abin10]GBE39341.1 hypothetical protein BMS3Bbin08_01963 [bacterium BMS3Bbin08]HDH01385.1 hypothetical protein [Nitrospirota bacterium]HDH51336.1 hypothetical protein [Nitrospirota bacterium]HDK81387.1 hypothetical protein [Nitrospirota bacterium]
MRSTSKGKGAVLKVLPVVFTAVLLITFSQAAGTDWKPYAKSMNKGMEYLYSPESLDSSSAGIVKVWTKIILLSQEKKDKHIQKRNATRLSTDGYENIKYSLYLMEFDCKNKMHSRLSYKDYDRDLSVLDSYDYNSPLWKPVVPESSAEQLYKIVCPVNK